MVIPMIARTAAGRALRLIVVAACALALGACDKCRMPTWNPDRTPGTPLSCHDDPPAN